MSNRGLLIIITVILMGVVGVMFVGANDKHPEKQITSENIQTVTEKVSIHMNDDS